MTKHIGAGVLALGLLFSVGFVAAPAQAASLTSTQISAILSLLSSFGADRGTINSVSAALGGSATSGTLSCSSFSNVHYGNFDTSPGGPVSQLQTWLGISATSFGYGTYGPKTQAAWNAKCGTQPTFPSTSNALSATPTSGSAPLTVEFHISQSVTSANQIDFGDDKTNIEMLGNGSGNSCGDPNASECSHTYSTPGTYTAHVYDVNANVLGTAAVTVTGSNSAQSSATIDQSSLTTGSASPTITGSTTAGAATFVVSIKNSSGATVYSSAPSINNGRWSVTISPALASGTYQVIVYGGGGGNILTTGNLTVNSAQPSAPISCTFNGQTITSGNSISAYQAASVPSGQQCVSQQRTCTNGSLSGSYTNASCVVAAPTTVSITSYPNFNNLCYAFVTGYANGTNVIGQYAPTCTDQAKSAPLLYSVTQEVNGGHAGAANAGRSIYMSDYDYASDFGQWIKANFYPSGNDMIQGMALDTANYSKTNVTGWPLQKGTMFFGLNDISVAHASASLDKNIVVEFDMRVRGDDINNTMNPGTYSGHRITVGMLLNWPEQSRSNTSHYFEVDLAQTPGYLANAYSSDPSLPACHDQTYDRCWYDPNGVWSEVRYMPYATVSGSSPLNFVTDQWVHVRIPLSYAKTLGWVSAPNSWSGATLQGVYIGLESTGATRYWTEVKNYQVYYTQ